MVVSVIQFNLYLGIAAKIIFRMKMNTPNTDLESIKGDYTREKPTALRNTKMVMWFPGFSHLAALVTEMGKPYASRPF